MKLDLGSSCYVPHEPHRREWIFRLDRDCWPARALYITPDYSMLFVTLRQTMRMQLHLGVETTLWRVT